MERQKKVKNILKEKKLYDYLISSHKKLSEEITNLRDLYNLGIDEKNDEIIKDCEIKLSELFKEIKKIRSIVFLVRGK